MAAEERNKGYRWPNLDRTLLKLSCSGLIFLRWGGLLWASIHIKSENMFINMNWCVNTTHYKGHQSPSHSTHLVDIFSNHCLSSFTSFPPMCVLLNNRTHFVWLGASYKRNGNICIAVPWSLRSAVCLCDSLRTLMQLELICFLFHSGLRVGTVRSDCLGFHPSSVLAQMWDFVQITPSLWALVFSLWKWFWGMVWVKMVLHGSPGEAISGLVIWMHDAYGMMRVGSRPEKRWATQVWTEEGLGQWNT